MRFCPLIAVVCLLLLPGCGDQEDIWGSPLDRANYDAGAGDTDPFEIGPASKWAQPGLYLDYVDSHNVALKSGNGMLVALLLVSPDTGGAVRYDRVSGLFRDPQSDAAFTDDGLKWGGSADRPSLPRCRIRHLGQLTDPDVPLTVDPSRLYRQKDQQWSKSASYHMFIKERSE